MPRLIRDVVLFGTIAVLFVIGSAAQSAETSGEALRWDELPSLPDELGLAGPYAGISQDALVVAGGTNFLPPVWENRKRWHDKVFALVRSSEGKELVKTPDMKGADYRWIQAGRLPRPLAYGAAVTYGDSLICMGGSDGRSVVADVFALTWNPERNEIGYGTLPSLPSPCAYGAATIIGDRIYLAGGQSTSSLESAMRNFWVLDMSRQDTVEFGWTELSAWPGPERAFNLAVSQHNGFNHCVYVMSGRRITESGFNFLTDVYEFDPESSGYAKLDSWRRVRDAPSCVMAGTAAAVGQSHIFVMGGADGSLLHRADQLREEHPGFPKRAWAFHTITGAWTEAGETPANHVTTVAVPWEGRIVIPTGEVKPRVRSRKVWAIEPVAKSKPFGAVNYLVLLGYLLAMVGVGIYFTRKNQNTEDFFRGGQQIVWWAAGCSIFATMLSSLTYTGIPAKAYAQDMVYLVGNLMIPVVSLLAVVLVLPFFRQIDATSAYEYLERRFSRPVRLFGSASFVLFHIFRMAVIMSMTGLALAVATPLGPAQSVLIIGILSVIYCTMGGIEAVIWTDTVQTFVLLGGALLAFYLLISGVEEGFLGFIERAGSAGKFSLANFNWDITSTQIALWVIVLGGIGQNISSYTADQAVVQRYMTTSSKKLAARSIWTNALLSIPASILFFGIGAALFAFYSSHPDRLDPTITTDQVFPLFIANEMPIGIAGLIVAGLFAAAQSTVSTSMNSTATAVVTDFIRPFNKCSSERGYLNVARFFTLFMGLLGTWLGLVFVNPEIRSLFDAFIMVIGLFMGVLGGLFLLGMLTCQANDRGAMVGVLVGAAVMFLLWNFSRVNGYIFAFLGLATCFIAGYVASLVVPEREGKDLAGLTIFTTK